MIESGLLDLFDNLRDLSLTRWPLSEPPGRNEISLLKEGSGSEKRDIIAAFAGKQGLKLCYPQQI